MLSYRKKRILFNFTVLLCEKGQSVNVLCKTLSVLANIKINILFVVFGPYFCQSKVAEANEIHTVLEAAYLKAMCGGKSLVIINAHILYTTKYRGYGKDYSVIIPSTVKLSDGDQEKIHIRNLNIGE